MLKPSLKNYSRPRPVWMQVLGDTMLYAGSAITTAGIATGNSLMAYIALGLGIGGYFFSKLFAAIEQEHAFVIEQSHK